MNEYLPGSRAALKINESNNTNDKNISPHATKLGCPLINKPPNAAVNGNMLRHSQTALHTEARISYPASRCTVTRVITKISQLIADAIMTDTRNIGLLWS